MKQVTLINKIIELFEHQYDEDKVNVNDKYDDAIYLATDFSSIRVTNANKIQLSFEVNTDPAISAIIAIDLAKIGGVNNVSSMESFIVDDKGNMLFGDDVYDCLKGRVQRCPYYNKD